MKSPWKIFSLLTSRRRSQKTELAPFELSQRGASQKETLRVRLVIANPRPAIAHDGIPRIDLMATTAIPEAVPNGMQAVLVSAPVEELRESVPTEVKSPGDMTGTSVDQALDSATARVMPRTKSGNSAIRDGSVTGPQTGVGSKDDRFVTSATVPDPALEAVSLDDEIQQLRQQLAEKLLVQNDQLRKMIERFDRY
jgi:hypothetical protein